MSERTRQLMGDQNYAIAESNYCKAFLKPSYLQINDFELVTRITAPPVGRFPFKNYKASSISAFYGNLDFK